MHRGKVLIAEDSLDIQRIIQINLQSENYETIVTDDGKRALELIISEKPDLVILDILLPKIDGWQILKAMKEDPELSHIPVIVVTGTSLKDRQNKEMLEGVEGYLSKPFNPLSLIELVEEVLTTRQIDGRPREKGPGTTRVAVAGLGKEGVSCLRFLMGNPHLQILGVADRDAAGEESKFASDLGLTFYTDPEKLLALPDLDVIIETGKMQTSDCWRRAQESGIEVIRGKALEFIWRLLEQKEVSHKKEMEMVSELSERVRELSLFGELARVLTSSLEIGIILERILSLASRIIHAPAGAVLVYDKEAEKFAIGHSVGLSERFKSRLRLSLSDPLIEDLMTLRKWIQIPDLRERFPSHLLQAALEEGMGSLLAVPLVVKEKLVGVILVLAAGTREYSVQEVELLYTIAGQAAVVIENARLYEAARGKQILVEQLLAKVIQAQEEERKRIAAGIHDSIAQSLVGILAKIQTCQSLLEVNPEGVKRELEELRQAAAGSVKEVRQIIFDLRPSSLDDLGLIPSLENYIKRFEREHGIIVNFVVNERERRLPPVLETVIFRLIQETLTNIKKHSGASQAWINLELEPLSIALTVTDDGKGFNWEKVSEKFERGESFGIQSMRERASLMGGKLWISSEEGKGTKVFVQIPIARGKVEGGAQEEKEVFASEISEKRCAKVEYRTHL